MSDELTVWLQACLDDVERVARAAAQRTAWRILPENPIDLPPGYVADVQTRAQHWQSSPILFGRRAMADLGQERVEVSDSFPEVSDHIALHDPARVLAQVAATRRLVARCVDAFNDEQDIAGDALRLLALPFADRDGYREEWRPDTQNADPSATTHAPS